MIPFLFGESHSQPRLLSFAKGKKVYFYLLWDNCTPFDVLRWNSFGQCIVLLSICQVPKLDDGWKLHRRVMKRKENCTQELWNETKRRRVKIACKSYETLSSKKDRSIAIGVISSPPLWTYRGIWNQVRYNYEWIAIIDFSGEKQTKKLNYCCKEWSS